MMLFIYYETDEKNRLSFISAATENDGIVLMQEVTEESSDDVVGNLVYILKFADSIATFADEGYTRKIFNKAGVELPEDYLDVRKAILENGTFTGESIFSPLSAEKEERVLEIINLYEELLALDTDTKHKLWTNFKEDFFADTFNVCMTILSVILFIFFAINFFL